MLEILWIKVRIFYFINLILWDKFSLMKLSRFKIFFYKRFWFLMGIGSRNWYDMFFYFVCIRQRNLNGKCLHSLFLSHTFYVDIFGWISSHIDSVCFRKIPIASWYYYCIDFYPILWSKTKYTFFFPKI